MVSLHPEHTVVVADAPAVDLHPYASLMRDADLRIAADGGARYFSDFGLVPHVAIGDFDSLSASLLSDLERQHVILERYPVEKDETDLELALLYAIRNGARRITVLAALGGRPDQHLANLQLLTHSVLQTADVRMLHAGWEVFAIHDVAEIHGQEGQTVSLLPMTECVEGIVTNGLYYPLRDESLQLGPARGVSNVMTGSLASVSIRSGILLAMHQLT